MKTKSCTYSTEEENEAKIRCPEHYQDALHIIIAEREKADYIITRNVSDFINIGTDIPIRKPELL